MVAPRVGAWIETQGLLQYESPKKSHPVWVRGLKPLILLISHLRRPSHPVWVRGLKHNTWIYLKAGIRRTPCGCVD